MTTTKPRYHLADKLWDLWCITSLIGIWPRFVEPNLLKTTHLNIPIANLSPALSSLKIFVFSDLHINNKMPQWILNRLVKKIKDADPDLIFFTGDFLSYSKMDNKPALLKFLTAIPEARYGNFAIAGNHDYNEYLAVNEKGEYDTSNNTNNSSLISKGFTRLFCPPTLNGKVTPQARSTTLHPELLDALASSSFRLLHNETVRLTIKGSTLNICGLGEYMGGHTVPSVAYQNYDDSAPGIILLHNPDAIPLLSNYPGELLLAGHTHGGQINLPWIWQRLAMMEHPRYKRGLLKEKGKHLYISRGVGAIMTFRWFSLPEILIVKLIPQCEK